jgi:hypothetical protein
MEVVILQVFVSLVLVVGSILLFAFTCHARSFDHADRLALLPLDGSDRAGRDTETQTRDDAGGAPDPANT